MPSPPTESCAARLLAMPGMMKVPTPRVDLFILRDFLDPAQCASLIARIHNAHALGECWVELPACGRQRRDWLYGDDFATMQRVADQEGTVAADAPGVSDDGSGTAAVMEMACVMARYKFDATLVFMAVAAEVIAGAPFALRRYGVADAAASRPPTGPLRTARPAPGCRRHRAWRSPGRSPACRS